ncbi:molybdate ABC transporter substrate-binding protein [Williamsia herbipolensis]|uniref:molybdate ABC transporter substrate-binding protein n=1 Tax=Williamsia herbipolensis TaxID=1603258 RepID=UPI0006975364|nr:molybdate ABC transporter substrate-binding protein [Williamsia herbipolensis]
MNRNRIRLAALAMTVAALATACSSNDSGSSASDSSSPGSSASGAPVTLTVFAAASLKKGFTEIAQDFEKAHPNVTVKTTFDGSSALVTQIKQGASADVIATADQKTMTSLGADALDPTTFTRNVLTIITAPGNPKNITSVRDLARSGVTTVLCAPQVPCGNAAATVEKNTGVDIRPASEETSVSGVVTKVTSGQADAGLVYTSDAKAAGSKVAAVNDPAFAAVVNEYPIATVKGTQHAGEAKQFIDLVTGTEGQQVLNALGFGAGR